MDLEDSLLYLDQLRQLELTQETTDWALIEALDTVLATFGYTRIT